MFPIKTFMMVAFALLAAAKKHKTTTSITTSTLKNPATFSTVTVYATDGPEVVGTVTKYRLSDKPHGNKTIPRGTPKGIKFDTTTPCNVMVWNWHWWALVNEDYMPKHCHETIRVRNDVGGSILVPAVGKCIETPCDGNTIALSVSAWHFLTGREDETGWAVTPWEFTGDVAGQDGVPDHL